MFSLKKLVAITLLIVHLFNLVGYPFLFRYLAVQSDWQAVVNIDKENYNTEDLIEIKIPIHLPYASAFSDYERYDGETTYQGVHYNYVKRKTSPDTLYLLCLPNKESDELLLAQNQYSMQVNDFEGANDHKNATAKKGAMFNHYCQQETVFAFVSPPLFLTRHHIFFNSPLRHLTLNTDGQPPQAVS